MFKKQVSHYENMNNVIKMLSAITCPVVKLVAALWTHEMTGVILYFERHRHLILCWHPLKSSSLSDCIQLWRIFYPQRVRKKRSGLFDYLTTKMCLHVCLHICLNITKNACVLLHRLSQWHGKYIPDLVMQYFTLGSKWTAEFRVTSFTAQRPCSPSVYC